MTTATKITFAVLVIGLVLAAVLVSLSVGGGVSPEGEARLDQIAEETGPGSSYCENWGSTQALPPSCK